MIHFAEYYTLEEYVFNTLKTSFNTRVNVFIDVQLFLIDWISQPKKLFITKDVNIL